METHKADLCWRDDEKKDIRPHSTICREIGPCSSIASEHDYKSTIIEKIREKERELDVRGIRENEHLNSIDAPHKLGAYCDIHMCPNSCNSCGRKSSVLGSDET